LQKIIKFSSNIGASQIGLKIGARKLDQYIRSFGFGARTGIDLPGETKGIVRDPDNLSKIGIANSAFGQGISVTAIQLVSALSALANGGILMRPYVVDRIIDQKGQVVQSFQPKAIRRVISPETSREVIHIMKQVVAPGGTGTLAALPGYGVAGKTGTAQKIDPLLKTYADKRYVSSFMGFVPADDARLAILVVIDEPKGTPYGGVVAAPVFRKIAEETLRSLGIPPRKVIAHVRESTQRPERPERPKSPLVSPGEHSRGLMPNLSGLSMRAALMSLGKSSLDIRISGRGILQEQSPRPGARLEEDTVCHLTFAPPA
jgi:cell division protein FtsI (penicillin-binding protein 3)